MLTFPRNCCWLCGLPFVLGCMYPAAGPGYMNPGYMAPGYPGQQPMYAPPQNLNPPGTLVIPPSNAPFYNPSNDGSTYESIPRYDWQPGSSGGSIFPSDGVPTPRDPGRGSGSPFYEDDLNRSNSGVQLDPQRPADLSIASDAASLDGLPVAAVATTASRPVSYGFDTNGFRWIQGILNYHPESDTWSVTYNRGQDDPFLGDLTLIVSAQLQQHLQAGAAVQVRGQLDRTTLDARGRAVYRVEQLFELPIAVARLQ